MFGWCRIGSGGSNTGGGGGEVTAVAVMWFIDDFWLVVF